MCVARTAARRRKQMKQDRRYQQGNRAVLLKNVQGRSKLLLQQSSKVAK